MPANTLPWSAGSERFPRAAPRLGVSCKPMMAPSEPRCTAPIRHRSRGSALLMHPTKPAAVARRPDPLREKGTPKICSTAAFE
jgi:hypothetical protein